MAADPAAEVDAAAPRLVSVEVVDGEAIDIETSTAAKSSGAAGASVILADGRRVHASKVVLATGNEAPADLPGTESLAVSAHSGWCGNPWKMDWSRLPLSGAGHSIVLLGTGLTTVDCIITLLNMNWEGSIHAVSRHALLPLSHFSSPPHEDAQTVAFPPPKVVTMGLEKLVALLESECARLTAAGGNPALLVDKLRPFTQRIWQGWSLTEKKTFVAKHAARWNILRHRIAPSLFGQLQEALQSGRLQLTSGSIRRVSALSPSLLSVELTSRSSGAPLAPLHASLVINCTGPHTRFSHTASPLLQNLLARGLVQPDEMDMGVAVRSDFSVDSSSSAPSIPSAAVASPSPASSSSSSSLLYALGPLLRGTLWESIAVPELRGQAQRLAQTIVDDIASEDKATKGSNTAA